jgi:hypothetical protein
MSENEIGLGRLFIREAVRAATWGVVLLVVMGMFLNSIKQDIREGIAYGASRFFQEAATFAGDADVMALTKQLVKGGVQFTLTAAAKEARGLLKESGADPGKAQGK